MGIELVVIAWVRKRFLNVALRTSLIQVTLGGIIVAAVGPGRARLARAR